MKIKKYITFIGLIFAAILFSATEIMAQKGIVKFDYEYKSNAQGKLNAERNRGNKAKMYYDSNSGRWIVEVDYDGANSGGNEDFDDAGSDDGGGNSSSSTGTIFYHYEYKSNAQGKLKVEQRRGKRARMYYNKSMRRWTVEIEDSRGGSNIRNDDNTPTVTTTKRRVNTSANVGSGSLPNGATVSYFPDKQMAEEIHRAAVKQGDWTKMWYDENRRAWAVAIKVR